jgi:hypothetical protein
MNINIFIFIVCQDHSTVKIIWFWLKFQLSGKAVTYKILEVKVVVCSMVFWSDGHRMLMIL